MCTSVHATLTNKPHVCIAPAAGMARAHLAKWVAAATVVQRAVRAWLFRRRLQQWLQMQWQAALVLQSAWRGRQARQQQAHMEACCILIQVCDKSGEGLNG
jgi:hypothetical protein